ncbi:MAG: hypothetical protein APF84_17645 [Gracilibacter sp. BRH_c7a]|nr:MAG: hypothetical protein APF84_17645 [Gracilibacter sp. BRH_c7a]
MNVSLKTWQNHLEIGIKCLSEGNISEAEKHLEISMTEAEQIGVPVIIAFSQRLLATAYLRNDKLDEAQRGFQRALEYCQMLENKKGIAEAKAGLANVSFINGQYTKSISLYKEALSSYPQGSSSLRLAVMYTDLGQVYVRMKEWTKAEECFTKGCKLCRECDYDKGEAEIDLYLGEINYNQGKINVAKRKFTEAARVFSLIGEEVSLANALQYLAFLMLEKERYDEALLYQYRVIALYFKNRLYAEVSESYYLLSNIFQALKLLDEAEQSLNLSLRYYKGYELGLALRYHGLAMVAIMKKEYVEAQRYYYEALRYFQFFGDGSKVGDVCEELTFLLKYKDVDFHNNYLKEVSFRYLNKDISKYEIMTKLAYSLKNKGNDIVALKCGWKALEIAKANKYETLEIEKLIQNISESIRKSRGYF